MAELEAQLQETQGARLRMIATDGVFSMDGYIAKLDAICDLAEKYDALVMVDDCHATGFVGKTGRGTPEHCGVMDRVDIITSHARQGARRRAAAASPPARKEIVELLRQRSRPYLFSNTLAPPIVGASLAVLELLDRSRPSCATGSRRTPRCFRDGMTAAGFDIQPGDAPDRAGHARRRARSPADIAERAARARAST